MKRIAILAILFAVLIITWCDREHNFMDVDNPNAKEDLKHYVPDIKFPEINTDDIIPDSLSWVRNDAKWYADQYYQDNIHGYVDVAKEWLSWAVQDLKWYYNNWVDELNQMVSDKVNWAVSGELNKFKIK